MSKVEVDMLAIIKPSNLDEGELESHHNKSTLFR